MSNRKIWWRPIAHFAAHMVVGCAVFLIFGSVSVGLALLVQTLERINIPSMTLNMLAFIEHVILIVDGILFVVYVGIAGIGAIKEMTEL